RMEDMFRDLEQEFTAGTGRVPVDVREDDGTVTVRADLPGVETDRIDLTVDTDTVTIAAEDEQEVEEEQENFYRRERRSRRSHRSVPLPARVDPDTADATYENGVLTVTMEKSTSGTGRTVDIT
ncbi:MAG: Hsp20/alpha crystallin family protein, partial [Candidatus Nanohaloarchaea archaeon]